MPDFQIEEVGANRRLEAQGLDAIPSSTTDVMGAVFGEQLAENYIGVPIRWYERTFTQVPTPGGHVAARKYDEAGIYLSPEEANRRYGVTGELAFSKPVPEPVAIELYERKKAELARNYVMNRGQGGAVETVGRFAAGLGASAIDPLGIAAAFIPVVGPARYAAWLAGTTSLAGRAGVRAGVGVAEGLVGSALLEPLAYYGLREEQADYDATDSLLNLAFGGILGGGLHAVPGAIGDAVGRLRADTREQALRAAIADIVEQGSVETPARVLAPELDLKVPANQVAFTAAGRRIDTRLEVVEADSLVTSHDADLNVNPAFPAELQPRDRSREAARAQIAAIAGDLQPERLGPSAEASTGAPIVGPEGVVESGNGRVLALRLAAQQNPQGIAAYRNFLRGLGFDLAGMREPVLIRRRTSELGQEDLRGFTVEAQDAGTLRLSATERALADARLVDAILLGRLKPGGLENLANADFVRGFVDRLPQAEQGAIATKDGRLSQEGRKRIEGALLARAYDDPALLARVLEATDQETRAIAGAMLDVAPQWAVMRAAAAEGRLAAGVDITADLVAAVRLIDEARRNGVKLADALGQQDMLGGGPSDLARILVRLMFRDEGLTRPKGRDALARDLADYAEQASRSSSAETLFGGALGQVTPESILNRPRTDLEIAEDAARAGAEVKAPAEALADQVAQLEQGMASILPAPKEPAAPVSPPRDASAGDALAQETAALRPRLAAAAEADPEIRAELERLEAIDAEAAGLGQAYQAAAVCIVNGGGA